MFVPVHLVANSLPNWIIYMEASNSIVWDRDGSVDFHHYAVPSQTVNGSEEDVLRVGTYKLRLHGGNTLVLHDAIYAH